MPPNRWCIAVFPTSVIFKDIGRAEAVILVTVG